MSNCYKTTGKGFGELKLELLTLKLSLTGDNFYHCTENPENKI